MSDTAGEDEFDREPHPEAVISDSMRLMRFSISVSGVVLGNVRRFYYSRALKSIIPCWLALLALDWGRNTGCSAIKAMETAFAMFFAFYLLL